MDAAVKFMTVFYYSLVITGKGIGAGAVYFARKVLIQEKERRGRFGHRVPLQDWVIPVVYNNVETPIMEFWFIPGPLQVLHCHLFLVAIVTFWTLRSIYWAI